VKSFSPWGSCALKRGGFQSGNCSIESWSVGDTLKAQCYHVLASSEASNSMMQFLDLCCPDAFPYSHLCLEVKRTALDILAFSRCNT
jgi:hypothetical protein